jgi:hypothetical protein
LEEKVELSSGAPIYTDGSCYEGEDQYAAAAGSSAVQVLPREGAPDEFEVVRAIWGPVPCWRPQTAASAEHAAVHMAAQFAEGGPITVVADCASVIAAATHGRA